ncbi:MAG: DUF6106 family protein [Candidatus Choladocola sp.]|nr:DUF6106 family protein [Candidatus Choladocola sp.]
MDSYREILVQRKTSMSNQIIKFLLIALTAIVFAAGLLFMPILLVAAIALGVASYFVIPRLEVEYEYLYVNGELDIDTIYSKQKRKKTASYDMAELELLAPSNSHALDYYRNNSQMKLKDFSSGNPDAKSYILVFNREKGQEMVKAELDDVIIADIRRLAPRKVNLI